MNKEYYFNTGLDGKNAIQVNMTYDKRMGGYAAMFQVGDMKEAGWFGWHIDSDYFRYYQKPQARLLVPCGRRSAKKEQEAAELLDANVLTYVQECAEQAEALGAPHMEISVAA